MFGELTKKFADVVAKDKHNRVITYSGGIFGYALFRIDRSLGSSIAGWFKVQLMSAKVTGEYRPTLKHHDEAI
jgi:hypothetical protein